MEHYLDYKTPPKYKTYLKRHEQKFKDQSSISENEFNKLSSKNCYYCGVEGLNGIDRLDSSIGYTKENCVPCCKHCNYAKGNLSMDHFKEWARRFVTYQKQHEIWKAK
jgi:hypothetical protein